ncbi:umta methyltransferase family protein [Rutstroemia sp. NJR-2017a BVV2]|nr:umta methyltransferase family protein [Rutstroemia sp. NJR-2017a BVV2]
MDNEPDYLLVRDMHASIRLNLQHYLWKDGLGYLLHPSISLNGPNTRIADLGTGTGIWVLDLARQLPETTQLYGFDISDAQYPHPKYLPPNVKLEILDNLTPDPPSDLQGTFDVVYLRLWLGGVPNGDPTALLTHALKLLRPGGYIQWNEFDPLRAIAEGPDGEPSPNVRKLCTLTQKIKDHRWIERLPTTFQEFGLENIEEVFAFEQPWQSKLASDMACSVVHEMSNNPSPFVQQKLKDFGISIPSAFAEISKGARFVQPFCVALGRKPVVDGSSAK